MLLVKPWTYRARYIYVLLVQGQIESMHYGFKSEYQCLKKYIFILYCNIPFQTKLLILYSQVYLLHHETIYKMIKTYMGPIIKAEQINVVFIRSDFFPDKNTNNFINIL